MRCGVDKKICSRRSKNKKENETKYNKALIDMKDELREKEGEEIAEKLKGKIREWFQTEQ